MSHLIGNFAPLTKRKPKNWIDKNYKIMVPYDFKWRHKIGKVECDCKECEEDYMPWYGMSWYHSKDCALMKYVESHPQLKNLNQYYDRDFSLIAQTE